MPPRCPPGWTTGAPDYVGVGTQKSGTTWWNRVVSSHPQIHCSRKEVHFFQKNWSEELTDVDIADYYQYFPRPAGELAGEWTPRYMLDPWTPPQLRRAAPDARILVLLRDPMARLHSGLRHMLGQSSGPLHPRLVNEAIALGRYGEQLNGLVRHFPREQILVLQFERCLQDPQAELARTFAFIGVDPEFVPDDLRDPVNKGRGPELSISSDLLAYAGALYAADRNHLLEWTDLDLGLWPEPAP